LRKKVRQAVTATGIPVSYLDAGGKPEALITDDSIRAD